MPAASRLILASGSPRRKDLLNEYGFTFEVISPDVVELEDASHGVRGLTAQNAHLKGSVVAAQFPNAVVIAADTLVLLEDQVLSKPRDLKEATTMLASLNGRAHQVFTAVSILHLAQQKHHQLSVTTDVRFKTLTTAELAAYHQLINPMDKAGAYAAQEHGDLIIEGIAGSMTNVIGLPMDEVVIALRDEFGITA